MELNGETQIEANIFPASDAEAALKSEFSENEQREAFTFSEQMDYARLIEEIETAKALERKAAGGRGGITEDMTLGAHLETGKRRSIVGAKINMSGTQYDRAKYIADNAPSEIIEQLDRGERTIRSTYDAMRGITKKPLVAAPENSEPEPAAKRQRVRLTDYKRLQSENTALKAKTDDAVIKFADADHKREILETQLYNTNLQWECEREGKNGQIAELNAALDMANLRISELEAALVAAKARINELEAKI
jgi:hypothetical protein